jgi:hypothetical protein
MAWGRAKPELTTTTPQPPPVPFKVSYIKPMYVRRSKLLCWRVFGKLEKKITEHGMWRVEEKNWEKENKIL